MKRFLFATLFLPLLWLAPAHAQTSQAVTVTTCGAQSLSAGNPAPMTMDLTGKLCDTGSGGGGASVTPLTPYISAALEACHVMKASAATGISFGVTTGATAGYLMVFNSTTAPADGAVTPAVLSIQVPANATVSRSYTINPLLLTTGFTVCFSSTGPFTKTASATAMLEGTFQ